MSDERKILDYQRNIERPGSDSRETIKRDLIIYLLVFLAPSVILIGLLWASISNVGN